MTRKATKTGRELERRVANAYREMGAWKVEHDVELAGNQIDVYVELKTSGHLWHRIAVEAKDRTRPVGVKIVNDFAQIVDLLRRERLIDEGVIVSAVGFTRPARNAAETYGIQLLEPTDLYAMAAAGKEAAPAPTSPVSPAHDLAVAEERTFLKQNIEQCLTQLAEKPLPAQTPLPTPQPGEGEQLPLVEIVTPSGRRVRGWLVEILRDPLHGSIATVLALLVAICTLFWHDIRALLFPTTPTATPTSTVTVANLPEARVGFTVAFSDGVELGVPAGGTLTLTPGEGVLIETSVTVGQLSFPRDLAYQYRAPLGSIPKELVGSRTSYIAPNQPGPDFITVLITDLETGDQILRSINVVVKEKSPQACSPYLFKSKITQKG
jgi:hypothetical protein